MKLSTIYIDERELGRFTSYQRSIFFTKTDGGFPVDMLSPHIHEHEVAIKTIFRTELGLEVKTIEELTRRTLHYVYRVMAGADTFIIRINAVGAFYRELSLYTEAWVMDELEGRSLPNVEIVKIDTSRDIAPFDYAIMGYAEGTTMFDRIKSGENPIHLIGQLGAFVASIHEIKTSGFGPFYVGDILKGKPTGIHNHWGSYLSLNLDRHIECCAMAAIISDAEASRIHDALVPLKGMTVDFPVFLHGDVANHNTFVDNKQITAIIDWEDCISGDSVWDIAYYGTGCFGNDDWLKAFLSGYKSIAPIPDDFERRFNLYYLRIALFKAILRERFKPLEVDNLPNSRDRILHGLSKLI